MSIFSLFPFDVLSRIDPFIQEEEEEKILFLFRQPHKCKILQKRMQVFTNLYMYVESLVLDDSIKIDG